MLITKQDKEVFFKAVEDNNRDEVVKLLKDNRDGYVDLASISFSTCRKGGWTYKYPSSIHIHRKLDWIFEILLDEAIPLRVLNLNDNGLSLYEGSNLCKVIKRESLKALKLSGNCLGGATWRKHSFLTNYLVEAFRDNPHLELLDLSNNRLTYWDIKSLTESLMQNARLWYLDLSSNEAVNNDSNSRHL